MADDGHSENRQGDTTLTSRLSGETRTFSAGDIIDGAYRLTDFIGQGGMGVVYACRHIVMEQEYAIKVLSGEALNEEVWARFRSEAQALARLNHPHIVRVHNMGIDAGRFPYLVMDLLSGNTLDQQIRSRGHLPLNETLSIFIDVAQALTSAHGQGIIHRDIKPSNLILSKIFGVADDTIVSVKIVDFGIARLNSQGFNAQTQTATGMVFGTPYYMSPEQCQGARVDERSDIYSFGCALYETLTGRLPFEGENAFLTFMLHQTQDMPSLSNQQNKLEFPVSLEKAVQKMLAKNPADRYQTMAQVRLDLKRIRAGKSIIVQGVTYDTPAGAPPAMADTLFLNDEPAQKSVTAKNLKKPPRSTEDKRIKSVRPEAPVEEDYNTGSDERSLTPLKMAGLILLAVTMLGGLSFATYRYFNATGDLGTDHLLGSEIDPAEFMTYNYDQFKADEQKLEAKIAAYRADPATSQTKFKQSEPPVFVFPSDFYLATIKFGDDDPIYAVGTIPIPPMKRVTLQLSGYTDHWPELLNKFAPYDLNGLEVVTKTPREVIKIVETWGLLDDLNFFNTVIKALPQNEKRYDESRLENRDLPLIDKLSRLKAVGLCGPALTGEAIGQMKLLDTIHTLRIKRISDIDALLPVVAGKDNITELWVGAVDLTDDQLKPLTAMKNLRILRLRRSKLTPASAKYFQQMPALQSLYLDRGWLKAEEEEFRRQVPAFKAESSTDMKYWRMFPDAKN